MDTVLCSKSDECNQTHLEIGKELTTSITDNNNVMRSQRGNKCNCVTSAAAAVMNPLCEDQTEQTQHLDDPKLLDGTGVTEKRETTEG